MTAIEKMGNLIKKLRSLPEKQRLLIFYGIMFVSFLVIGFFVFLSTKEKVSKIGKSLQSVPLPKTDILQQIDFGSQVERPGNDYLYGDIFNVPSEEAGDIFKSQEPDLGL